MPEMKRAPQTTNLKAAEPASIFHGARRLNVRTRRAFSLIQTMKTKITSLLAVGLLCSAAPLTFGQGTTPAPTGATPTDTGNFFTSVEQYFSSFNTNLDSTFATARGELATGVDSTQGGVPLANSMRLSWNVYSPSNSPVRLSLESVTRNSGVAGTLVSEQAGVGLNFVVHDAKLTIYGDGGYNFNGVKQDKYFGEIGVRAEKALTEHTFAGVGVGAQLPANRQVFQVFAGFTF
jgi:hypothetical protein